MAKSLKTNGMQELDALKRRVTRQFTLRRITRKSHDDLLGAINTLEVMITELHEEGGDDDGE